MSRLRVEFAGSVREVKREDWNACAGDLNPFVSHQFLCALEESKCVGPGTGWLPQPLILKDARGCVRAVAPCYLKLHSKGEYIFDYHWADAYHRLVGEDYYPKLQVAVPFTPVPGPRLLLHRETSPQEAGELILAALSERCREGGYSSVHLTFCQEQEWRMGTAEGYLPRLGEQYHWFNEGYGTFDDFLSRLTSRKRKTIRRERRIANSHPLKIETLHGDELSERQLVWLFRMYENTCLRKWGRPYLNLDFFRRIAETMPRRLVVVLVGDLSGKPVAAAWNLRGQEALFGRNWGCLEHFDMLHFEVCYYRALDYAIEQGLSRVEAGAQGTHKIQRGYRPRQVYSLHHLESESFRRAIEQYLQSERLETNYRLEALSTLEPFKQE